jgi:hypothetical protein
MYDSKNIDSIFAEYAIDDSVCIADDLANIVSFELGNLTTAERVRMKSIYGIENLSNDAVSVKGRLSLQVFIDPIKRAECWLGPVNFGH